MACPVRTPRDHAAHAPKAQIRGEDRRDEANVLALQRQQQSANALLSRSQRQERPCDLWNSKNWERRMEPGKVGQVPLRQLC